MVLAKAWRAQLVGGNGRVVAETLLRGAAGERQAGDMAAEIGNIALRSRGRAGVTARNDLDVAQQALPMRIAKRPQRAGGLGRTSGHGGSGRSFRIGRGERQSSRECNANRYD